MTNKHHLSFAGNEDEILKKIPRALAAIQKEFPDVRDLIVRRLRSGVYELEWKGASVSGEKAARIYDIAERIFSDPS